ASAERRGRAQQVAEASQGSRPTVRKSRDESRDRLGDTALRRARRRAPPDRARPLSGHDTVRRRPPRRSPRPLLRGHPGRSEPPRPRGDGDRAPIGGARRARASRTRTAGATGAATPLWLRSTWRAYARGHRPKVRADATAHPADRVEGAGEAPRVWSELPASLVLGELRRSGERPPARRFRAVSRRATPVPLDHLDPRVATTHSAIRAGLRRSRARVAG